MFRSISYTLALVALGCGGSVDPVVVDAGPESSGVDFEGGTSQGADAPTEQSSDGDTWIGRESCADLKTAIGRAESMAASSALTDVMCSTAEDCREDRTSPRCFAGCGSVVNAKGHAILEAAAMQIDAEYCDRFDAAGCQTTPLPCPDIGVACVKGACVVSAPICGLCGH